MKMVNNDDAYMAKRAVNEINDSGAIKNFQNMAKQINMMKIPSGDTGKSRKAAATFCSYLVGSVGAAVIADAIMHEMTGSHAVGIASAAEDVIPQKEIPALLENESIEKILGEEKLPDRISNEFMAPNSTAYFSGKNTVYKIDFLGFKEDIEANITDLSLGQTATAFLRKRGSNYDVEFRGNGTHRKVRISGYFFDGKPINFSKISAYEVPNKSSEGHYNKTVKVIGNKTAQRIKNDDIVEIGDFVIKYKGNHSSGNKADKLEVSYKNRTSIFEISGKNPAAYINFGGSNDTLVIGGNGYYDERKGKRIFSLNAKVRPSHRFEDITNTYEAKRELGLG